MLSTYKNHLSQEQIQAQKIITIFDEINEEIFKNAITVTEINSINCDDDDNCVITFNINEENYAIIISNNSIDIYNGATLIHELEYSA